VTATPTNAPTLSYQLTFVMGVSDLAAADFTVSGTATGCVVSTPTGGPSAWSIVVTGCSEGTVTLTLSASSVTDALSNVGPTAAVSAATVLIDRTGPTTSTPGAGFRSGVTISGTTLAAFIGLRASDAGAGVASYDIARSVDGAAFAIIKSGATGSSYQVSLVSGHTYRFEVRAKDRAGNVGAWVLGPVLKPLLVEQSSSGITWSGTWSTVSSTSYSGGSARTATAAGASASYTFSGRAFAVVVRRDPSYGQLRVYLDGTLVSTVDTGSVAAYRYVITGKTFTAGTHTLKLVVVGTSGRPRVVLDALEVMR
jgi:hypothetical protein